MTTGSRVNPQKDLSYNQRVDADRLIQGDTQPVTTITNVTVSAPSTSVVWAGGDNPLYRQKIANGFNATNGYSKTWTDRNKPMSVGRFTQTTRIDVGGVGNWKVQRILTDDYRHNSYELDIPAAGAFASKAETVAVQQFIRQARQRLSEAQALVTLGEGREAVRMILGARRSLFNKLRSFQSSAKKRAKGRIGEAGKKKAVAESWLEYSFGWAPLIGDVTNLANAAAATVAGSMRSFSVSGSGRDVGLQDAATEVNMGFGGMIGNALCLKRTRAVSNCWYKGAMAVHINEPGRFKSQFGLTMDNWLPSIWELVPWSFAIDYFTGLGDFISSLTFPTSSLRYYCRTRKTQVIRELYNPTCTKNSYSNGLDLEYDATPPEASAQSGSIVRDVPDVLIRWPSFRIPGYKEAYINLAALGALRSNNRI